MTNLSLDNFEVELQKRINNHLNSYLNSNNQIQEAIKFALSAPGKRVRPTLIFCARTPIFWALKTQNFEKS